ncbi:MAG TPA: hypothetical protein VJH03_06790 [Blastocatellia bacterium]|nr:hypothetical protein [Blastocatellia bacterium]
MGPGNCTTEKSEIARDVLSYLIDNPDAQDTLEGIIEWWLLERKIESRTTNVKEALAELVTTGMILERKGTDLRVRYVINSSKLDEIRGLLTAGTR